MERRPDPGGLIAECISSINGMDGINTEPNCAISQCLCVGNGCRVIGNLCEGNAVGIQAAGSGNFFGPVIVYASDPLAGSNPQNHPWANFGDPPAIE